MFAGKARSLPYSGAPKRRFIRVGCGLTCKHKPRLEMPAQDKQPSLLQTFVNYGRKMFHNIRPWMVNHYTIDNLRDQWKIRHIRLMNVGKVCWQKHRQQRDRLCTWLRQFGQCNTERIISICVMSPGWPRQDFHVFSRQTLPMKIRLN